MNKHILNISILVSLVITLGLGCESNDDFEDVPLIYTKCPCDSDMMYIEEVKFNNLLLFDSIKTSFPEMVELSKGEEGSEFLYYSSITKSTVLFSIQKIQNITYTSTAYICNFPNGDDWSIPENGLKISFVADAFESCTFNVSTGTQFYSDYVLKTLKIYK